MEDTICLMTTPAVLWMLGSHDEYIVVESVHRDGEEETEGRRERCRERGRNKWMKRGRGEGDEGER